MKFQAAKKQCFGGGGDVSLLKLLVASVVTGTIFLVGAACRSRNFGSLYIDSVPKQKEQLAEVFYLLGVSESHVNHSYWISETEYFLEVAIRMAPKAEFARSAFNFLEDLTTAGYSGSAGVNIPGDVKMRIEELRFLVEGAPIEGPAIEGNGKGM